MPKKNKLFTTLIPILSLLFALSGCAGKQAQPPAPSPTIPSQTAEENIDIKLAGGKFGYAGLAVVGGGQSNKLWIIDAKYHKMVTTIDVGWPKKERTQPKLYPNLHDTHAITFTKDFKVMWTADWFDYNEPSYVIALDPLTFKEIGRVAVGKGAHHTALSPDDRFLYAANQYGGTVSVVDTKTMQKIKDLAVGEGADYITPSMYWDGKAIESPYLFVSVDKTNYISAIDWKKNEVVKKIDVGSVQHGVNLTPDGKFVWVANIGAKDVPVIDVGKLEIIKRVTLEGNPIHIVFSPDGKYAYICATGNLIYKIDTSNYQIVWKTTGTTIPAHLGVSPDGKEVWTLNHGMDNNRYPYMLGGLQVNGIQIFDTENGKLLNEVTSEAMPHEIQFVPYSAFGLAPKAENKPGGEKGKVVYDKNCSACHGASAEGDMGPKLATKEWSDPNKVADITIKGKGTGMPPYKGKLTDEEIQAVSQYVSSFAK